MSLRYAAGVLQAAVLMGVRMAPGAMLLMRTRCGASSCAMLFLQRRLEFG